MIIRKALAFEEVLKRFKKAEETKANKGTKKKKCESAVQNNKSGCLPKKNHNCEKRQNEIMNMH